MIAINNLSAREAGEIQDLLPGFAGADSSENAWYN